MTAERDTAELERGMKELTLWASTRTGSSRRDVEYMLGAFTSLSLGLSVLLSKRGASFEQAAEVLSTVVGKSLHTVYSRAKEEE